MCDGQRMFAPINKATLSLATRRNLALMTPSRDSNKTFLFFF